MNPFGITLFWAALQIAIVALAAVGLSAWLARRSASAAMQVNTSALYCIVILTGLLICPLPSWSIPADQTSHPFHEAERPDAPQRLQAPKAEGEPNGTGSSAWQLRGAWESLWTRLTRPRAASEAPSRFRFSWLFGIFALGVASKLACLLAGLWAIRGLRLRSQLLSDPELNAMLSELETTLSNRRKIEIRETKDLASPATVGWCRPIILLPSEWRSWSLTEQRSVLAHELAHITHQDYLIGLLARLVEAVHFYHPLVHWLGRRLRVQQELAADALGAEHAGGRDVYLRVLATMALRQEGCPQSWLARAFLPAGGTLMRRIQMLRIQKQGRSRPWIGKGAILALLVMAAGVAGLRSPAQETAKSQSAEATTKLPPLDLRYAQPEGAGVVCLRPAVLLASPELKPLCKFYDTAIGMMMTNFGWPGNAPSVADIEQIALGLAIQVNKKNPLGQQHALLLNPTMIRLVRPFDWLTYLQSGEKKLERAEYKGHVYYKADLKNPGFLGLGQCYYIADDRTLVMQSESHLHKVLDRPASELPEYVDADHWRECQQDLIALAFGKWDKEWSKDVPPDGSEAELAVIASMQHASHLVFGMRASADHLIFHSTIRVRHEDQAKELAEKLGYLFASDKLMAKSEMHDPRTPDEEVLFQFLDSLAKTTTLGTLFASGQNSSFVTWRAEGKGSLAQMGRLLISAIGIE